MRSETRIRSVTYRSDCYERLPERKRHQILQLKEGNHRVKDAQLIEWNTRCFPDPGVDPPAQSADQIEIICALYPETRLIHALREAPPGVPPCVSKLSIERSEQ